MQGRAGSSVCKCERHGSWTTAAAPPARHVTAISASDSLLLPSRRRLYLDARHDDDEEVTGSSGMRITGPNNAGGQ